MGILRNYSMEVAREHVAWARKNHIRRATMLRALGHEDEGASWDELVEVVAAAWYAAISQRRNHADGKTEKPIRRRAETSRSHRDAVLHGDLHG